MARADKLARQVAVVALAIGECHSQILFAIVDPLDLLVSSQQRSGRAAIPGYADIEHRVRTNLFEQLVDRIVK